MTITYKSNDSLQRDNEIEKCYPLRSERKESSQNPVRRAIHKRPIMGLSRYFLKGIIICEMTGKKILLGYCEKIL